MTRLVCAAVLILAVASPGAAQTPTSTYKTAGEFYLAYRAAFVKATTIDELTPWMSKTRRDQIAKETPADRKEMFEMIKMFDDRTNIKVVKESATATGAELQVEGISAESKSKGTGVITLMKEGTAWRVDRESWKGGM
ncbi:MAG: hypothetical protein AB7H93_05755 [Vicinamibacterales bacterium]